VISVETAALQARMRNVAMQHEMAHLIIHGLLHLAGYDDEEEAGRAEMIAAQNALVAQIGFTPEPNWCSLYGVVQP
jgi:rRNA maturation RNase YbeY